MIENRVLIFYEGRHYRFYSLCLAIITEVSEVEKKLLPEPFGFFQMQIALKSAVARVPWVVSSAFLAVFFYSRFSKWFRVSA